MRRRITQPRRMGSRAVAGVEFALVAGMMVVLLLVTADFGLAIWERMRLQGALAAGGAYARSFPTLNGNCSVPGGDVTNNPDSGITCVIAASLPANWTDVTIAPPRISCDCGSGDSAMSGAACSNPCTGGSRRVYVTLGASRPYSPLYFSTVSENSARYVVRVQ